ncbi:MAG: hypothetical protein ACI3XZ_09915 [Butyricicoccus sp.]
MKKLVCIVLAFSMILTLAACGNAQEELQAVAQENAAAAPAEAPSINTSSAAQAGAGSYLETVSFLLPYELDDKAKTEFVEDFTAKMAGYLTTVGTTTVEYAAEADIVAALKNGTACAGIISLETYAADSEGMTQMLIFDETGMTLCTSKSNEGLNAVYGSDMQLQYSVQMMIAMADDTASYREIMGVTNCTIPE